MKMLEAISYKALFQLAGGPEDYLPLTARQAWMFSVPYMKKYLDEHVNDSLLLDVHKAGLISAARLQWLLESERKAISGQFTSEELTLLQECYMNDLFFPEQFGSVEDDFWDGIGADWGPHDCNPVEPLYRKLKALRPGQRIALADLLEQLWYRTVQDGSSRTEVLRSLGIELA